MPIGKEKTMNAKRTKELIDKMIDFRSEGRAMTFVHTEKSLQC